MPTCLRGHIQPLVLLLPNPQGANLPISLPPRGVNLQSSLLVPALPAALLLAPYVPLSQHSHRAANLQSSQVCPAPHVPPRAPQHNTLLPHKSRGSNLNIHPSARGANLQSHSPPRGATLQSSPPSQALPCCFHSCIEVETCNVARHLPPYPFTNQHCSLACRLHSSVNFLFPRVSLIR